MPILVAPAHGRGWSDYGRVTLIKANCIEAVEELGREGESLEMARTLASRYDCHVVVTLGERGLVCAERDGGTWHVPAVPVEVRDVCGAGDAVLAALGLVLTKGTCLTDACREAVRAAARQVATVGIQSSQHHWPFSDVANCDRRLRIRNTRKDGQLSFG